MVDIFVLIFSDQLDELDALIIFYLFDYHHTTANAASNAFGRACLSVCVRTVRALTFESLDL